MTMIAKSFFKIWRNESGAGLIMAIFVIVILGLFGTLIARYTMIGATESVEEYLWAQALYSAESAAQLRLLTHDGGVGPAFPLSIEQFTVPAPDPDDFSARGIPATIRVKASRLGVQRKIEIMYVL